MYELIQVSDHCCYIESPAKIGLVTLPDGGACLIDSGNDKDAGKKVKRLLDAQGLAAQMGIVNDAPGSTAACSGSSGHATSFVHAAFKAYSAMRAFPPRSVTPSPHRLSHLSLHGTTAISPLWRARRA